MSLAKIAPLVILLVGFLAGCSDPPTVIPKDGLTEEQKQAIQAEDAKVADEESQGKNKKKK